MPTFPRWFASMLDTRSAGGGPSKRTGKDVDLGEVILGGRYRLEDLVGQGASSVVYRAHDTLLGQDVAIKVLRRDASFSHERVDALIHSLRNETRLTMRLGHPNILRVFHFESSGTWEYEVMELVQGENLHQLVGRRLTHALSIHETVLFGHAVLEALEHAHSHGVIHNDLKPANIMLCRPGIIKVCDFGLARLKGTSGTSRTVAGTPAFMSPERIRGEAGDPRSDLYSLGVTLFTLATGHTPFGDGRDALERHLTTPVPTTSEMPRPMHEVVCRAMAKAPANRYQSALEMLRAWDEMAMRLGISLDQPLSLEGRDLGSIPTLEIASRPETPEPPARARIPEPDPVPSHVAPRSSSAFQRQDRFVTTPSEPSAARPPMASVPARSRAGRDRSLAHMVRVEPGTVHGTRVGGFLLGRTLVTNQAYQRFVEDTGSTPPLGWKASQAPRGRDQHPVTGVTLERARAFARWAGGRLPTRLEWRLAYGPARFPWGDDWRPEACLGRHNQRGGTESVGVRGGESAAGCTDMLGNVWEWTETDERDTAPEPGKAWVCGGSFRHPCDRENPCTSVHCENAYEYLGFRTAMDSP